MDGGRNALRLERGGERIAAPARQADGVLRPDRGRAVAHAWDFGDIGERRRIAPRDPVAGGNLVREYLELFDQHRRLDGVEAPVQPDAYAIVLLATLAMHAQAAHD